jgi:hypothetical protein
MQSFAGSRFAILPRDCGLPRGGFQGGIFRRQRLEFAGNRCTFGVNDEAFYDCDACGEAIVVPIDLTQGNSQ